MNKVIRLPGLILFVVLAAAVTVTMMFFAATIVEVVAEDQLTEANGARVDIASVELGWSPLTLKFNDIQVTDPKQPMMNTVQVGQIAFSASLADLLMQKLLIDEMAIRRIEPNTQRTSSGAIEKKEVVKKGDGKEESSFEMPDIELPDVKEILSKEELTAETLYKRLDTDIEKTEAEWKQLRNDLRDKERWEDYDRRYEKIQRDFKGDFRQQLQAVKDARQLAGDLEAEGDRFKSAKRKIGTDSDRIEELFEAVKAAPKKDIQRIKDKYRLDDMSPENITRLIFGEQTAEYVRLAREYYDKIAPYLEEDAAEEETGIERSRGRDIRFREYEPRPDLLIRLATIDAITPRGNYEGTITDISSDQTINRKPTRFKIVGVGMRDRQKEAIEGVINLVDPENRFVRLDYVLKKQQIRDFQVSKSRDFRLDMSEAMLDMTLSSRFQSGSVKGTSDMRFTDVAFTSNKSLEGSSISSMLASSFADIRRFDIDVDFSGDIRDLDMRLKSDLDEQLGNKLKQKFRAQKEVFEKRIRAEIEEKLKEPLAKIEKEKQKIDGIKRQIEQKEAEYRAKLDDLKNKINQEKEILKQELEAKKAEEKAKLKAKVEAEKKAAQDKLDAEKRAQQEKLDAEKKAKEEELKKKLGDKLKGLF